MPENSDRVQDLHAQTQRVQTDFISADLDIAFTFLDLAHSERDAGETERAQGLLAKARQAADVVAAYMNRTPPLEQGKLIAKLKRLLDAIRETEASLHAR